MYATTLATSSSDRWPQGAIEGLPPNAARALLDDHGEVGVLTLGAVAVRVVGEVADREVAGRRGQGSAGRAVTRAAVAVTGPAELVEGGLAGLGVAREGGSGKRESDEQRKQRLGKTGHGKGSPRKGAGGTGLRPRGSGGDPPWPRRKIGRPD